MLRTLREYFQRHSNPQCWGVSGVVAAATLALLMGWSFSSLPTTEVHLFTWLLFVSSLILTLTLLNSEGRAEENGEKKKAFREWTTIWALIVTAGFIYGQYREMTIVLGPIQDQANTLRNSMLSDQRAYVHADFGDILNVTTGSPPEGYVWVRNTGKTPALNVQREVGIQVLDFVPKSIDDLGNSVRETGKFAIYPGTRHFVRRVYREKFDPVPVRSEEGKSAIYVFGTLSYEDIFEDKWVVNFCHVYYGQRAVVSPGNEIYRGLEGRFCDFHNDIRQTNQKKPSGPTHH